MNISNLPYNKLYKTFFLRIIIGILTFIFAIIMAEISANFINSAINKKTNTILAQGVIFILFIIFSQSILFLLERVQNKTEKLQKHNFKMEIYERFLEQTIPIINNIGVGGVKERISRDTDKTSNLIVKVIPLIIIGIITGTGYLIYMLFINTTIAFILFAISFIQLIPPYIVKKFLQKNYEEAAIVGEEWMDHIIAGYKGLSTIKMNNLKSWYGERLKKINKKNVEVYKQNFQTVGQEDALHNAINSLLTYGTYAIIGIFVLKGYIKIYSAIKIVVLCTSFYKCTDGMYRSISEIFISQKAKKRLLVFMNDNIKPHTKFVESKNLFEFKNVSFGYRNNSIFENINIEIPKGVTIGILGKNGVGKSTLIKLLLGIEDNYVGEIKFNGIDIKNFSEEQLYSMVAYVSQQDSEFNMSPMNLFEMIAKASSIEVSELIKTSLNLGLSNDSLMANSFLALSGGERKKICLTAGITRKSEVLILDEPTNSLDIQSQQELIKIILALGKTVIVISHNEDLINQCDYKLNITQCGITFNEIGGEVYA